MGAKTLLINDGERQAGYTNRFLRRRWCVCAVCIYARRRAASGTICRGMYCVSHVYAHTRQARRLLSLLSPLRNAVLSSPLAVYGEQWRAKTGECVTTLEWQVIQRTRDSPTFLRAASAVCYISPFFFFFFFNDAESRQI